MPTWLILTVSFGIFFLLIFVQAISGASNPIRKALGSMMLGILALAAVNLTSSLTGVMLPVSFLSLGVSAAGGIPGVTMLLLMNLIC